MSEHSDILIEIRERLVRVEEGIKHMHEKQDKTNGNVRDHAKRLDILEERTSGLVAKVGIVVTIAVTAITSVINKII